MDAFFFAGEQDDLASLIGPDTQVADLGERQTCAHMHNQVRINEWVADAISGSLALRAVQLQKI